jgi:TonB family protein
MILNMSKTWMKLVLSGLMVAGMTFVASSPVSAQEKERTTKTQVKPVYPELAKRMRLSGKVRIEVTISADGTVKNARVVGGHPVLAEAAKDALRGWRFESAAGETRQIMDFVFNMNE